MPGQWNNRYWRHQRRRGRVPIRSAVVRSGGPERSGALRLSVTFEKIARDTIANRRTPDHDMDSTNEDLVSRATGGDENAAQQLFVMLYDELHLLAKRQLARNGGGLTLGSTTLLHEAYLSFAERSGMKFDDRGHFMAYAARAMRGLIVDYSRNRQAQKRGGELHITGIADTGVIPAGSTATSAPLEALSDALQELARIDAALATLVDLHFFCGFSLVEVAAMRGVSDRTVQRDWRKARLLLRQLLDDDAEPVE